MQVSQVSGELTMRWVAVLDANGRTRMEARWIVADAAVVGAAMPTHITHAA